MTDTAWHSVHIHHHERDRSGLVLDAVAPFLRRHRESLAGAYLTPHWRQGPHLRVHFRTTEQAWERHLKPELLDGLGRYLRDHPSGTVLDPAASLDRHRQLAAAEQETGPLTPWLPNNSLHFPEYVSRAHALGDDPVAAELLEDFSSDTTPLLIDQLQRVRRGADSLDGIAFGLLLSTAHTAGGVARNVGSFRAHGEGYLAQTSDPDATRSAFDRAYRSRRDVLLHRLDETVAALDTEIDSQHWTVAWAAAIGRLHERAWALVENGLMTKLSLSSEEALSHPRQPEYNRIAYGNPEYVRRGLRNPEFLRYRVVLNWTYLHLTRLGLSPRRRFLLCHLAAETIEERYGVSAIGFLRTFVAEHP